MNHHSDSDLMRLAIAKAREGILEGQTPFGACIARAGEVVSCEHNAVWQTTDITAHEEIQAIREACRKLAAVHLAGCVIYSTCEPCPMCFSACHWAGISKIVYGANIQDALASGFRELRISNTRMKGLGGSPVEIVPDFLREEAAALFYFFDQQPGKRTY